MAEYTKEEALAFIESMRLTLSGQTGFKWLDARLVDLESYVADIATENERLKARADSTEGPSEVGSAKVSQQRSGVMTDHRGPDELISAYRNGAALVRAAIEGMDADALRARPIAGKMSSLEVVCHIVDSDQFMCDRVKRTVATERPLLMGVESAVYPGPLNYHDRDPELDLRLLEAQREQLASDLERLAPDAWGRTAVHSENGTQTLLEIFEHAVDHLESHVTTIAEKRTALGV